ncbi:MAG TPA: DoxX family protein [Candidatus Sulfomarinibacteraceae bacterium]|nr:DoxX family protein [Candidatus Sulfomarinibacteraceae bacterium]
MLRTILHTDDDAAALVLRVMLAVVIFPHGAQKLLGWFGGNGFSGTMTFFTDTMGIPWILALLVIVAEFFGSLGLLAGFLTRVAALGIGMVMTGAIFMVHLPHGFFMNWNGNQAGEGFEYHLLVLAIVLALLIRGGGAWSVDRALALRRASAGRDGA